MREVHNPRCEKHQNDKEKSTGLGSGIGKERRVKVRDQGLGRSQVLKRTTTEETPKRKIIEGGERFREITE